LHIFLVFYLLAPVPELEPAAKPDYFSGNNAYICGFKLLSF